MAVHLTDTRQTLDTALAGRYTLVRELGRGGMATVYLAEDLRHDRPVALKVLRPELAASMGPERFLREIRLTARLDHPHILPVLDSGTAAGLLWYTMPYVHGETLRDRLRREVQLPIETAVDLTRQVASALDYAHRGGVVHRDLKPENILVSDGQARVADFGVAKALSEGGEGKLTETGLAVGTPAYMSPEQASGGAVDVRSDIYALGCVLYEMLAGEPPFTGPTPQAITNKRMTDPVPSVRRVREVVPEAVEHSITRALAKVPADRFPTAAEFARALEAASPVEGVAAARATASQSPVVGRRRVPRQGLTLAVAALLAMVAVVATLLWRSRTAPLTLHADLVAVAPFDVLDPELQLWREGLADLLSRSLDGAGPLRTVSPTVVIRRWAGRAERESAEELAASTGAGVVVYGALVPAGPDSVRLTANVLQTARAEIVGEAELRGHANRVEQLADSVAVRVLRELGRARPLGAASPGALSSRSVPALRAFLRGEQAFRRSNWEAAQANYEDAVTFDTTFAQAYWRLGLVRDWQDVDPNDSHARAYYVRAGALNLGLAPRESLLIVSDSLRGTLEAPLKPGAVSGAALGRLFGITSLLTRRYPTDPEAWVALGEARYHYGDGSGGSAEMALGAFARAVALDSSYAPTYIHAVELALELGDEAAARLYAARFLALRPGLEPAREIQAVARLLDPIVSRPELHSLVDTLPTETLLIVWSNFMLAPDSSERSIQIAREFATRRITEDLWYRDPAVRQGLLGVSLASRGHLREALEIVKAHEEELAGWGLYTELALGGVIPTEIADEFFRQHLEREPFLPASALRFAPPWWGARGDTSSLKRYIGRLDSPGHDCDESAPGSADRYWLAPVTDHYWRASAQAYLALARGDTVGALRGLATLPDSLGTVWFERLTLARLLVARGSEREALGVLDREFPYPYPIGSRAVWELERARLAERLREMDKARRLYGYVAQVWRHADPELQPLVNEAKRGLRRLISESDR